MKRINDYAANLHAGAHGPPIEGEGAIMHGGNPFAAFRHDDLYGPSAAVSQSLVSGRASRELDLSSCECAWHLYTALRKTKAESALRNHSEVRFEHTSLGPENAAKKKG